MQVLHRCAASAVQRTLKLKSTIKAIKTTVDCFFNYLNCSFKFQSTLGCGGSPMVQHLANDPEIKGLILLHSGRLRHALKYNIRTEVYSSKLLLSVIFNQTLHFITLAELT